MERVLAELGETSRRLILSELKSGPRNVGDIVEATGLKQPNVSNHLARMRAKGIVKSAKVGREVVYTIATPEIESLIRSVFSSKPRSEIDLDWASLALKYARAASNGDEQECATIVDAALRAEAPMIDVYQDLLTPAMQTIGTWYGVAAIDEAQEHMASAITERMLVKATQLAGMARRNGMLAVLACPENNHHVIALRMVSDFLRAHGWRTLFLGANVPMKSLVATIERQQPHLVLMSCASEEGLESALTAVRALHAARNTRRRMMIGVGGPAAVERSASFEEAGADFIASSLRDFADRILPAISVRRSSVVSS